MGSEIQKVSPLSSTKAPIETVKRPDIASVLIGDEMNKLAKDLKLPSTPQGLASIKLMVVMAYPEVKLESLTDFELQTKYFPQYIDGTLQKKFEANRPQRKETLTIIKNEKRNPSEVATELLDKRLALHHKGYEQLPESKKEQLRDEAKLKFLKTIMPEKFKNVTPKDESKAIREFTTTTEALIYAFQTGKISSKEDVEAIFNDPHRIGELQYEWAADYFNEHPGRLEKLNNHRGKIEDPTERRMYIALQRGNLDKAILAASGMNDLEELYHSGKYTELKFAYLKEHENELNNYEKRELAILRDLEKKNHGDWTGVQNYTRERNIDLSLTEQIMEVDGVDIQNDEIEIKTKEDIQKLERYTQFIKDELNECQTEDELKVCIQEIRKSAQTDAEAQLLDKIMNHILAEFSEKENNLLTPEFYINSLAEIGISPHMAVATSTMGNEKTQMAYTDIVASSDTITNTQKAGFTEEVTTEFETPEAKLYSVNKMTDTGIKEVHDVLPDTYAKLDNDTAQKAFEHAMNSDAVSDEQKAIIARDTIDNTQNDDLKKFYEELANKYNVDYTTVPPKSERTRAPANNKPAENNSNSNTKVAGTDYTEKQFNNLIATTLQKDSNPLRTIVEATIDTANIILGKTSEPKYGIQKITTLQDAMKQLEAGNSSFAEIFHKCTPEVKKDFVKGIMQGPQKEPAIKYLLEKGVPLEELKTLAQTANAKKMIQKIAERITSDSTIKAQVITEQKKEAEPRTYKA